MGQLPAIARQPQTAASRRSANLEERGDFVKQVRGQARGAAALAVLPAAGAAFAMTGAEVVQTRRSVFGEMTSALKYIAGHWDDTASYGDLAQAAAVIERDAKNLPKLFPAGTSESDGLRT